MVVGGQITLVLFVIDCNEIETNRQGDLQIFRRGPYASDRLIVDFGRWAKFSIDCCHSYPV